MISNDKKFGAYGDATGGDPTVGVTISPWVIGLVAAVWLLPKLFHTYRTTRHEKKP